MTPDGFSRKGLQFNNTELGGLLREIWRYCNEIEFMF